MAAHVLPDRERRHLLQFYIAPRLDYPIRMGAAAALIAVGFLCQLFLLPGNLVLVLLVSLPPLLAGNCLLLVRGYDTTPKELGRKTEWVKTTRDRFLAARELEKKSRRWDETFVDVTCYTGFFFLLLISLGIVVFYFVLEANPATAFWAPVFGADVAVLLLPHWFTGTRRGWRPVELRQHIDALEPVLKTIDTFKEPPCQVQCMFEMTGKDKEKTPVGARVFVRFPEGPEDFLGVQFQVSLNNVQGTKYPYLYAVLVAKKGFGLTEAAIKKICKSAERSLCIEKSEENDVEVVVIRQKTTKESGYHTKPARIREIAQTAWECCSNLVAESESRS
jgi:hypothetical protein